MVKTVYNAGKNQFKDYWGRDSFWACLGALALGDSAIVKKNLQLFLQFEKNGLLPLRVGNKYAFQTYFKWSSKKLYPTHGEFQNNSFSTDTNSLFIIVLCEYISMTKDYSLFEKNKDKIERILDAVLGLTDDDLLIQENYYSTWMDGICKKGATFYSNVLFHIACSKYVAILKQVNISSNIISSTILRKMKKSIKHTFWNDEYFVDWKGNADKEYFDTFANLIAIYFNFASSNEKKLIFSYIKKKNILRSNGSIVKSFPDYANKYLSPLLKISGMKDYCCAITYPWMSFFYFACLKNESQFKKTDLHALNNLCDLIVRDGVVHECYDFSSNPFKKLFYSSENPFAWACSFGIFLIDK